MYRLPSQYRSHGYLFNLHFSSYVYRCCSLNTVLTVISLIFDGTKENIRLTCLNTVLTVISLIMVATNIINAQARLNTVLTVISLII